MVFIWEIIYQRKNGAYVINFDEFESIGTHWIALYVNSENVTLWWFCSWTYYKRS